MTDILISTIGVIGHSVCKNYLQIAKEYFFPDVSAKLATASYARSDVYATFYHNSLLL